MFYPDMMGVFYILVNLKLMLFENMCITSTETGITLHKRYTSRNE